MALPVSKIMRKKVAKCKADVTIFKAVKILKRYNTSTVVIVDNNNYVIGIFSERDLVNKVVSKKIDVEKTLISEVMTSPVYCGDINQTNVEISNMIVKKNIRKIPIVKDFKLVGIVAEHDILVNLAESFFS